MIEAVLFGSGRHLFPVPDRKPATPDVKNILVAWNGSRECARALAEATPYLHKAKKVAVVSVIGEAEVEEDAQSGSGRQPFQPSRNQGYTAPPQETEQRLRSSLDRGGAQAKRPT
jgi:hypothetical protein